MAEKRQKKVPRSPESYLQEKVSLASVTFNVDWKRGKWGEKKWKYQIIYVGKIVRKYIVLTQYKNSSSTVSTQSRKPDM